MLERSLFYSFFALKMTNAAGKFFHQNAKSREPQRSADKLVYAAHTILYC